ncbi:hypothetical protein GCM10010398_31170 [Streptomyces fimbriatus]
MVAHPSITKILPGHVHLYADSNARNRPLTELELLSGGVLEPSAAAGQRVDMLLGAVSNIDAAVLGHRRDGWGDFCRPHRGDSNQTAGRTGKHRVPAGYFWVTSVQ